MWGSAAGMPLRICWLYQRPPRHGAGRRNGRATNYMSDDVRFVDTNVFVYLQHGQKFGRLRVVNPFLDEPRSEAATDPAAESR